MHQLGTADSKQILRQFVSSWHAETKASNAKLAANAKMFGALFSQMERVLQTTVFTEWLKVVANHKAEKQKRLNADDTDELVGVVKELESAYHTERYQCRVQKERIKELEAEMLRIESLLASEKETNEMLKSSTASAATASAQQAADRLEKIDERLSQLAAAVTGEAKVTQDTMEKVYEVSSMLSRDMQHVVTGIEHCKGGRSDGRAQAFEKYVEPRHVERELRELEEGMQQWHRLEDMKRQAVQKIQQLGGSPPRAVTMNKAHVPATALLSGSMPPMPAMQLPRGSSPPSPPPGVHLHGLRPWNEPGSEMSQPPLPGNGMAGVAGGVGLPVPQIPATQTQVPDGGAPAVPAQTPVFVPSPGFSAGGMNLPAGDHGVHEERESQTTLDPERTLGLDLDAGASGARGQRVAAPLPRRGKSPPRHPGAQAFEALSGLHPNGPATGLFWR
jgi:hypothetical protein